MFLGLMPEKVQWPTREDFLEVVSSLWKKGVSRTADLSQSGPAFPCVWRNSGKSPQDAKQLLKVMGILRPRQVAWGLVMCSRSMHEALVLISVSLCPWHRMNWVW